MIVSVSYDQPSVWWAELIRESSKGPGVQRDCWVNASYVINEANRAGVSKLRRPRFFLPCLISAGFPARLQESTVIYLLLMNSKWKETKTSLLCIRSALLLFLISRCKGKQAAPRSTHRLENRHSEPKHYSVCFKSATLVSITCKPKIIGLRKCFLMSNNLWNTIFSMLITYYTSSQSTSSLIGQKIVLVIYSLTTWNQNRISKHEGCVVLCYKITPNSFLCFQSPRTANLQFTP